MPYNEQELLSLPPNEKVSLAEELWASVEEELSKISNEEVVFAEERLKLHQDNPDEGTGIEELTKHFKEKYGF